MEDLYGTYSGFMPTDRAWVAMGEMRVHLDASQFSIAYATGAQVRGATVETSQVREMTPEELTVDFDDDADIEGIRGIIGIDACPDTVSSVVRLLFIPAGSDDIMGEYEAVVVVRGLLDEEDEEKYFTPFLFTPQQVADGKFETAILEIEQEHGETGVIALINNGGRTPNKIREN